MASAQASARGVLALRMSALYAGLAVAAVVTTFVLTATTRLRPDDATAVLVAAALGFVVGRTPPGNGPARALATRRLAILAAVGVALGAALMGAMSALFSAFEYATGCADAYRGSTPFLWDELSEHAAAGAEIGAKLAAAVWIVSLPGLAFAARRAKRGGPPARRC